jgi:peptide/nickel transport system substrate-binding protein
MLTQSRVLGAASLTAVAGLMIAGCGGGGTGGSAGSGSVSASAGTLTIAVGDVPATWDPYKNDYGAEASVEQAAYDTLIRENANGSLSPDLATAWKLLTPTEWQLTIRHGVKFADGSALTPDVVKENLDRAKTVVGPKTDQLSGLTDVTVAGDNVILRLAQPDPAIPLDLSQVMGMMVSPRAIADPSLLSSGPDGAGPYVLGKSQTVLNSTYTFTRNPNYWDPKAFPYSTVVIRVITNPTAALNAVRSGQVELAPGTAENASAAKSSGLTILQETGDFVGLAINDITGKQVPALGRQKVRQAMLLAINRPAIVAFDGAGTPTAQIFPKATTGYDQALDKQYTQPHVAEARKLLAEAGYPNGFSLTITSYSGADSDATAMAQDLNAVGIKATINDVPLTDFETAAATAPIFFTSYAPIDTYYDSRSLLLPDSEFNPSHKSDPELNSLISQYATATSLTEQQAIGKKISDRETELGWFIVAYDSENFFFASTSIDAQLTPLEATVALWNVKPAS